MRCMIWYHLHNLKIVKNTQGGMLLLVKLQAKWYQIVQNITNIIWIFAGNPLKTSIHSHFPSSHKLFLQSLMNWWWIVFVVWLTDERRLALFSAGPLSEILTIANLRHASRVWTCAEPEFRLSWMNLCSSDNHYTPAPFSAFIYLLKFNNRNPRKRLWVTFKFNNKNTRTTSVTSFWCFYY